jgi:hypothetical protein
MWAQENVHSLFARHGEQRDERHGLLQTHFDELGCRTSRSVEKRARRFVVLVGARGLVNHELGKVHTRILDAAHTSAHAHARVEQFGIE